MKILIGAIFGCFVGLIAGYFAGSAMKDQRHYHDYCGYDRIIEIEDPVIEAALCNR